MDKTGKAHRLRRRSIEAVLIVAVGLAGLVALLLKSGWLSPIDAAASEVIVEAVDGNGYSMAWVAAPYPLAVYEGRRWPRPWEPTPQGWAWSSVGDFLSLEYPGPLSDDSFDPEASPVCQIDADPREMAAMVNHAFAIRYPGANTAIGTPLHPTGEFFSTELPQGGQVFLRLPRGSSPAEVTATLGDRVFVLTKTESLVVLKLMLEGKRLEQSSSERMLEDEVIWADCGSCIARERPDDMAVAYAQAVQALNMVLVKYEECHGSYPQALVDLITVPGAVISRLPLNPYAIESQLGLEADLPPGTPTVKYVPKVDSAGVAVDYELSPVPLRE